MYKQFTVTHHMAAVIQIKTTTDICAYIQNISLYGISAFVQVVYFINKMSYFRVGQK